MKPTKDEYGGKERRKYPRIQATFVEYSVIGEVASKEISSFTEDVSAGGICILSCEKIETDSLLSLKIYLPDGGGPIEAKGKVAWAGVSTFLSMEGRKHYDLGIEFIQIDEKDRLRIYKYTSERSSKN